MKKKPSLFNTSNWPTALVICSGLSLLFSGVIHAQETWTGGGADNNFGTGANWLDGSAPSVGSSVILQFSGGTRTTPNNNYTSGDNFGEWWQMAGATGPFTIGGNGFGLFNKIENSSSHLFTINTAGIFARDGSMEINPVAGNITTGVSTNIELDGNAVLDVFDGNNNRTLTINGALSNGNGVGGNGLLRLNQTATVILTGTNDYGGTTLNNSSKLRVGAGGTTGNLGVGNVILNNTSSLIFDRSNAITVTNAISGAGSVTKLGADTLVLKATNSFSGGLTIKAGTVSNDNLGSGGNFLGSGTVTVGDTANTGAAATLNFNGGAFTSTNAISVVGNGVSTIQVTGWSQTLNGNVTLSNNLTVVTNNAFGSSMTFGSTGAFSGTGNLIIQSNAANNANISSNLTFSGSGGLNMIGTITNNGSGSSSGSGNVNTTISAVIGTNVTGIIQNSTNSQLILSGANSYTSNITVTAGTLSANLSRGVLNPTTSALGNPQTAGRTATIGSAGTLNFNVTDVMGNGGSVPVLKIIANGGTIKNNGNVFNVLGAVDLNGGTLSSSGGTGSAFPSFALRGTVTVGGSAVSTISNSGTNSQMGLESGTGTTFDVADAVSGSGSDLNVTGVLANWNSNAGFLIKTGVGTMTLTNQNTHTGGTRVDNGTLTLGHATNTLVNTGAVNVNGGILALGTNTDTVGAVTLVSGSITGTGTGTLTGTGSAYDVRSGTVSAKLGGTVGLDKSTAGTVTISSASTYTGATNITAGTLVINGNISTSSLTTVGASGTLGGTGTVGKTIVNGTLAVGNSPGQMNFTDTLGLNGTTLMEIDGTSGAGVTGGHDFVNLTGAGAAGVLTYGGTMTLDMGVIFAIGTYSWNLFDMASETGTFTSITLADQYSGSLIGLSGVWNLTSGVNTWTFTESTGVLGLTVVPEPNAAALIGGFGVLALLRRRR